MPYVRDTRRSIGLGNFVLRYSDISGDPSSWVGTQFPDRLGIGAYVVDLHTVQNLPSPSYVSKINTLPFFIPLRALTNRDFTNLLVAGKTMAQTYHVNGATRLQPIEWNSGVAAGAVASYMAQKSASSQGALDAVKEIQNIVKKYAPISWTLKEKKYP